MWHTSIALLSASYTQHIPISGTRRPRRGAGMGPRRHGAGVGTEDLGEVEVMKIGKVCAGALPAALATSGKTPDVEELLLCRPAKLQP